MPDIRGPILLLCLATILLAAVPEASDPRLARGLAEVCALLAAYKALRP